MSPTCKPKDYCDELSEVLEDDNSHGKKGLIRAVNIGIKTVRFIAYRPNQHGKKVPIKFCPFCGENLV